jgi:hypothetical protein
MGPVIVSTRPLYCDAAPRLATALYAKGCSASPSGAHSLGGRPHLVVPLNPDRFIGRLSRALGRARGIRSMLVIRALGITVLSLSVILSAGPLTVASCPGGTIVPDHLCGRHSMPNGPACPCSHHHSPGCCARGALCAMRAVQVIGPQGESAARLGVWVAPPLLRPAFLTASSLNWQLGPPACRTRQQELRLFLRLRTLLL